VKKKPRRYPRSQWVVCLNCDHQYEKEYGVSDEGCSICDSKECEPVTGKSAYKINDDWNDWR
jgi:hypothetical protein